MGSFCDFIKYEALSGIGYTADHLEACQAYLFRLRAPPSPLEGMVKAGEVLWSHKLMTIPMPRIEALAGYDYLKLVIDQVSNE